jgi:hypothetical protein
VKRAIELLGGGDGSGEDGGGGRGRVSGRGRGRDDRRSVDVEERQAIPLGEAADNVLPHSMEDAYLEGLSVVTQPT